MKPEIHPDAAKNFDEKARVLLAAVAPEPRPEPVEPPTHMFRPDALLLYSRSTREKEGSGMLASRLWLPTPRPPGRTSRGPQPNGAQKATQYLVGSHRDHVT